jgi:hypothetical protein
MDSLLQYVPVVSSNEGLGSIVAHSPVLFLVCVESCIFSRSMRPNGGECELMWRQQTNGRTIVVLHN